MVIFIPPEAQFDLTEHALLAAGARILDSDIRLEEIS
jgi:hypothetical protein